MRDKEEKLLTVGEVAEWMSCSIPTIYRWMANDDFPVSTRIGGSVRWRASDIREFLDGKFGSNPKPPQPRSGRKGRTRKVRINRTVRKKR